MREMRDRDRERGREERGEKIDKLHELKRDSQCVRQLVQQEQVNWSRKRR